MYNGTLSQREMLWKTFAILDMKGDVVWKTNREGIKKIKRVDISKNFIETKEWASFISTKPKLVKSKIY